MARYADAARGQSWTGVFEPDPPPECRTDGAWLVLTACHRVDDAFYEVGQVVHEVAPRDLIDHLPTVAPHVCAEVDICWILDLHCDEGIVGDREVSEPDAARLLGCSVEELHARVSVGQANHGAWVEHPVHRTG